MVSAANRQLPFVSQNVRVTPWLNITPDIQYIKPGFGALLGYGGGIALVIGALSYFMRQAGNGSDPDSDK